jgi:glc operon protein GlcG
MNIEQAIALQNQALDLAKAKRVEIAVAITDGHGELISFAKMDGAAFHAAKLAQNKAYTSARDRQPTSSLAK